jgi:ATP-dependent helicase/nuclease subunit B
MCYVGVRPHYDPVSWTDVTAKKDAETLIAEAETQLVGLLAAYCDPERGYLSRARIAFEQDVRGDYDHLARTLEWADAGGDEE